MNRKNKSSSCETLQSKCGVGWATAVHPVNAQQGGGSEPVGGGSGSGLGAAGAGEQLVQVPSGGVTWELRGEGRKPALPGPFILKQEGVRN